MDDSAAYSQSSWVGLGWDLDTGAVNRNMHGTDSDSSDDTFSISAGGVSGLLLPVSVSGTVTTYNTADQSFMKVQFDSATNKWTAWGTDGTKYEFAGIARTSTTDTDGCATAAQLDTVWRWSLTTITDTHGNQLAYSYDVETKSASCYNEIAVYPLSISYPNGKYSVSFVTEPRTDYQASWTTSSSKTLYGTKRLKEIKIQNLGTTVRRYALSYASNTETVNIIYPNFTWSAGGKTSTLVGVQEFTNDTASPALPAVTFTYGDNMHITNVNNGQGGQVAMTYEIWQYLDDYNENIRSLFERFGTGAGNENCVGLVLVGWTKVGSGTVKCDGSWGWLQLGNYTTGTTGRTRHSLPEHIAKPGGRYQFAITVSSQASGQTTPVEWGLVDTTTNNKTLITRTVGYGLASAEDSIDIPTSYNFAATQLEMYCQRCFISKVEFMQLPRLYRVTQRTVTVQPTGVISTYTYNYDNASPVSVDNSVAAASGGTLYSPILREFRGHVMSQVVNPEGLTTVNWFYQTDTLKGRSYDTLVLKRDFFDRLDGIDSNWVTSGGTHTPSLAGSGQAVVDFDYAIQSTNSAANWSVSFSRAAASLTSGDVAVAHVRLSGTSAQGEVGIVDGGGQFFGVTMQGTTATASNGTVLLNGNFLKDEWYGVMFFVDSANGSRMRIWQLDDPNNFGETVISGVGGGSWTFRDRVYNGSIWLDSYFEGIPYSETITRYSTTVQYDTVAGNGIPDLAASGLLTFRDLQIAWNTVTSAEQRNYNGDAKFVGTKQEFTYDTAANYGNLLTQKEYAGDNGTWTLYRGSKSEYYPNAGAYIVSLPARQVTLDCTSGSCDFANETGKVGESIIFYDTNTAYNAAPIKGEAAKQRAWVQNTDYSQASMGYDTYGNITSQTVYTGYATATQTTNPSGAQTTTTQYNDGGYNTYPTKVTNALSQDTTTTYNFGLGLPLSVSDPNLVTTSATYDGFGRMLTITAPGDATPTLQVTYYDTRIPFQIDLTQLVSGSASIRLSRFYDGAGRQIQTQTVGAVVNNVQKNVVVDTQYNNAGRAVKQSIPIPYTYDDTPNFIAQDFTQATTTTYDPLGRTLSLTQPNTNAVSYVYGDLTTTVTDPKLYVTSSTMDVWGRTTFVDAPEGPDVTYTYDLLNRLKTATRGGVQTQINYDAAGRKLNMTDPDMGYWVYQYDALGNLKFQTDARGCLLTLNYDDLNRLTSKTSSGAGCGTQVNTSFTYDIGTNAIGRRIGMVDDSGSAAWTYDARGRVSQETKVISDPVNGDQTFVTAWTYNSADLPITMTYPDNEVLTYGYNSDGALDTVTSSLGSTYVADTQYDEAGRITNMDYGASTLRKTFNYFPWNTTTNGGLLNTAVATRLGDSTTLQNFAYTYDKNANVSTIVDNLGGPQTQTFGYDSLNRLTSAAATGGTNGLYTESYSYSASTGNLSVKAGLTYTYDANHPHAAASLSNGNTYAYDANGNMTDRNADAKNFDLAYDAENRMVSVATAGSGFAPSGVRAREASQPPQQSGFPSTSVLDNFNRANGAIGSNWTGQNPSSFTVSSNQLAISASGLDSYVAWIPASFGADQEAYVTLSQVSPNGLQQGLLLKAASDGTAAIKVVYVAAVNVVRVFTYTTAGGWVQRGADISVTMNNGDQFGARAKTNGDVEVYKNGSLLATRDVTAWAPYTGGGLIGLWYSNVSSAIVDDFGGGNVVSGPTPTPTASSTPTNTPTATNTPISSPTGTNTPLVTNTPTNTATNTATPTRTHTPTNTSVATNTPTQTFTPTATSAVNTVTLQPNGTEGLDTFIFSSSAASNYGTLTYMGVGEDNSVINSVGRSLLKFDLSSLPANATITSATLSLWTDLDLSSNTRTIRVYRLKVPFNETQATWNVRMTGANWETAGAAGVNDRESVDIGSVQILSNEPLNTEKQIALTPARLQEMINGSFTNNGFIIVADTELNDGFTYKTSEHATSSQRPKLVIQYTLATATPSLTPSPTATFTPTFTAAPTITPTPSTPVFTSANFIYDGDDKRVKSILNMGVGMNTTYFVGSHYEVTNGTVTKYYYAGSQRIAMRTNGTLNYLLGDHLGSTSLTTDATGVVISELRYKAWGETRYSSGSEQTKYTYTGQYSYVSDFGLHFYNARWYDSSLSRFAQADTIVPSGVQGLDRYAYVNNSPVKYVDPSGHQACAILGQCADSKGIQKAIALMAQVSRGGDDILVAAGIAVQSQWGGLINRHPNSTSGLGPAQLSRGQLDTKYGEQVEGSEQYGLGLTGENPNDPGTAVTGMSRRIYQVVNACDFCTAQDKVIVAALAQNNGFTLNSLLKDVKPRFYDKKTGIDWTGYFRSRSSSGDPIAHWKEERTGLNYDTEFMLLSYTNDLLELNNRGWTLPFGLGRSDIYDIREKYLNLPRPIGGGHVPR